jgi:hypothetical protein
MTQTINTNQFAQTAIKGMLAKGIVESGIVAGIVDTTAYPGMPVKLSTGAYNKPIPVFTPTSTSEEAFGVIIYNARKSTLAANDSIEVAFCGGPVIWMEAAAAITAGVSVELANATDITVQTFSSGKAMGVALDGASAAGQLVRVIITKPTWDV